MLSCAVHNTVLYFAVSYRVGEQIYVSSWSKNLSRDLWVFRPLADWCVLTMKRFTTPYKLHWLYIIELNDEWCNGWMDGRTDGRTNERTNKQTSKHTNKQRNGKLTKRSFFLSFSFIRCYSRSSASEEHVMGPSMSVCHVFFAGNQTTRMTRGHCFNTLQQWEPWP
jgi:hypothetical protein